MANRYVRGDRAFTRLVKQLPVSVAADIRQQLNKTGAMVLQRAQSRVPVYSGRRKDVVPGALKAGLSMRVPPVRLQLKVGLLGKPINTRLFYGHLVEFGHRIAHGSKLPRLEKITARGISGRLQRARRRRDIRVGGVAPRPFLYTVTRQELYAPFQKMWSRALRAAAGGAGSSDD